MVQKAEFRIVWTFDGILNFVILVLINTDCPIDISFEFGSKKIDFRDKQFEKHAFSSISTFKGIEIDSIAQ